MVFGIIAGGEDGNEPHGLISDFGLLLCWQCGYCETGGVFDLSLGTSLRR